MGRGRERSGGNRSSTAAAPLSIEVDGEPVVVDTAMMSLRERQVLRAELAKLPAEPDQMDWLAGGAWITLRRNDPALTLDDVMDAITISDFYDAERVEVGGDSPEA